MIPGSNDSGYFYSVNRGKLSVTLDLRVAKGAEIFLDLVRRSDIVVENFAPGTMERFGLGYARPRGCQPRHHPVLDFGFRPDRSDDGGAGLRYRRPGDGRDHEHHRSVRRSTAAMRSINRRHHRGAIRCDRDHGRFANPRHHRPRTASGYRDARLPGRDSGGRARALLGVGPNPGAIGTRHPSITPFQQFHAAERLLRARHGNEALWARMCDAIGLGELKDEPRFRTNALRTANHDALETLLSERLRPPHSRALAGATGGGGSPAASRQQHRRVSRDPHLAARNMILRAEHPKFFRPAGAGFSAQVNRLRRGSKHSRSATRRTHRASAERPAGLRFRAANQTAARGRNINQSSPTNSTEDGIVREAVIIDGVRSAIGRGNKDKGYYKDLRADDLAVFCVRQL